MADSEIDLALTPPATIRVLMPSGHVEEMKLETYLAGAVAAEIGEKIPLEALKAQAVASRTYVVAAERHRDHHAHVCTTAHCQKWKRVDPVSSPDVFRALSETWGMVAVYDGNLIHTFFFEHCDGHTRNAEEMLIPSADYLRGVDCSCGHLTLKGHGVGMCKRGAIVMARRGATFAQILRHYYRGIAIGRMKAETQAALDLEEVAPPRAPAEASKKLRPRKIVNEHAVEEPKPTKVQRTLSKAPPPTPPESKPVLLKRPVLKHIVLSKFVPSDKPESIKPMALPVEAPRATSVDSAPANQKREREDFVVVPRAVAPAKPRVIEPVQADTPNPSDNAVESEPIIIRIPRKKLEQAEPVVQTPEPVVPPVLPTPTSQPDDSARVEPVVRQEPAHSENVPAAPIPTAEPVVALLPAPLPNVPETALPPLEGIEIKPMRRLHVDHLPGTRMIAGNLPRSGIVVVIETSEGKQTLVFSGTAPHYGEGGFETIVDEDGVYRVLIEGQTIEVKLQGETAFIHAG